MQIDSNYNTEKQELEPLQVTLGAPALIVGMEAAIRTMCVGETVRAMIPGPLAFNTKGGFLPYDTKVVYEIELISWERNVGIPEQSQAADPRQIAAPPIAVGDSSGLV